jgi:hypothetical protein
MRIGDGNRSPQTRRSEDTDLQVQKPTEQATPAEETAQNQAQPARFEDGFEANDTQQVNAAERTGSPTGTAAPGAAAPNTAATGTAGGGSMSSTSAPSESTAASAAQQILETGRHDPAEATHALAEGLRAGATQEEREALITGVLEQDPRISADILDMAGERFDPTGQVTEEDRRLISETLGQAWDHANPPGQPAAEGTAGRLDAGDLQAVLSPTNMHQFPQQGAQAYNVGNAIAASGSSSLQQTAATQMYDIGRELEQTGSSVGGLTLDTVDRESFANTYMAGAALAASGSTEAAQGLMNHVADPQNGARAVENFVKRTDPMALSASFGANASDALGRLMQAVGNEQATPAMDQFFDHANRVASGPPGEQATQALQQGLAQYFQTNMEHTTTRWAESAQVPDRRAYAQFAANVLFGDSFEGQQQLQEQFSNHIGERARALQDVPPGDPALDEQARQLGFLIGGAEVGFEHALTRVNDRNATRKAMVDFVFGVATAAAGGRVPNFKFGPVDVVGTLTNEMKQQVYDWVFEQAPKAANMTEPLYSQGLTIANDYHDEMQGIRGSFFDDDDLYI